MLESGFYATDMGEMLVVFGGRIEIDGRTYVDAENNAVRELTMNELPDAVEIGENVSYRDRNLNDFHPVRLQFYDPKSIDILIEQLQELKNLNFNN